MKLRFGLVKCDVPMRLEGETSAGELCLRIRGPHTDWGGKRWCDCWRHACGQDDQSGGVRKHGEHKAGQKVLWNRVQALEEGSLRDAENQRSHKRARGPRGGW